MNLQLVSPYKKCPFHCPFCVAATDLDYPWKGDLYATDKELYLENLVHVVREQNINTVVITGDTEPTLFPEWIDDCVRVLSLKTGVSIEIQTKNYLYTNDIKLLDDKCNSSAIDVFAYSITSQMDYERAKKLIKCRQGTGAMNRLTLILNKQLTFYDILQIVEEGKEKECKWDQLSVKVLQLSAMGISSIDNYIRDNMKILGEYEKQTLLKLGVWVDENCMDAKDRYIIFRTDGNVYDDWSELSA